jgi:thiol:disulfide interchange protein DsbD
MLTTIVAAPCVGPFLGPALGAVVVFPPLQAMSIVTAIGIGMALPYLFFSFFPALVRFLPRPGPWMITLKQMMGFLMLAAVIWLIWVFGAQTNNDSILSLMGTLWLISIGAWLYGKLNQPEKKPFMRNTSAWIFASFILAGGALLFWTTECFNWKEPSTEINTTLSEGWEPYSLERVAELQRNKQPFFIEFSAKWCLICQSNKVALYSTDTNNAFKEKGIVRLYADWTKKDPVITKALEKFGRSGVPLYLLYGSDPTKPPVIFPQFLTTENLIEQIQHVH